MNLRRAETSIIPIIITIAIIFALSYGLLTLNRNAVPENNVTMSVNTIVASDGIWNGTIIVSENGMLVSVLIPTEMIELSGSIDDSSLTTGSNTVSVIFDDLAPGVYTMIFTFRGVVSQNDISTFLENVEFK